VPSWKSKDLAAVAFGHVTGPVLRYIGRHRSKLPRFQKLSDKTGFQLRSDHYYEPTYSEAHLPPNTMVERPLPGLDMNEAGQLALLARFIFADELAQIPLDKPSRTEFGYRNNMYGVGDAEIYYSMIRAKKPRRIIEIGSGNSTLMAKLAIDRNGAEDPDYSCEQICIEPFEAAWLESVGVQVIRERVETISLEIFDTLGPNDILFIDSSHVIRPWGDVLREFLEIVPSLRPGVIVHVHDIFTPRDYPEPWLREQRLLWNEQYILEAFLSFNSRFEIICAANWLRHNHWAEFSRACPMIRLHPGHEPGAFWFAAKAPPSERPGTA
jgi:predicted O-methyltransferase YrrM